MKFLWPFAAVFLLLSSCEPRTGDVHYETASLSGSSAPGNFDDYWYSGQAELNRFSLKQARYGEVHEGYAVMVFVTEPFLKTRQVKSDGGNDPDAVSVMKLNNIRKFTTGIYDYSMMTSVFTPVDRKRYPQSIKATSSSQEWCGHTFSQLNLNADRTFSYTGFSYFESEGDEKADLPEAWLEDELWNVIRIDPNLLPAGKIEFVPGLFFSRLRHTGMQTVQAFASLNDVSRTELPGKNLRAFSLDYGNRSVSIFFERDFPHRIAGWEESYVSGWGPGARKLSTLAIRTHQIQSAYWNEHALNDEDKRKKLGLSTF